MTFKTITVAQDDQLWIAADVPWEDTSAAPGDDIRGLLEEPHSWVNRQPKLIKQKPLLGKAQPDVAPELAEGFFIRFMGAASGASGSNAVQGIHGTGMLTVQATKKTIGGFKINQVPAPPVFGTIEITLSPESLGASNGLAFIHFEIGSDRAVIAQHVEDLCTNPRILMAEIEKQFKVDGILHIQDAQGRVQIVAPKITLDSLDVIDVTYQGLKSQFPLVRTDPIPVPACDALLGTYIIVNGVIKILIDSSIVKVYPDPNP